MPSFKSEDTCFNLCCSSGSVPSSSAIRSMTDVILRLSDVFHWGQKDGLVVQLHIWVIAKFGVRVMILISLRRSRAE